MNPVKWWWFVLIGFSFMAIVALFSLIMWLGDNSMIDCEIVDCALNGVK